MSDRLFKNDKETAIFLHIMLAEAIRRQESEKTMFLVHPEDIILPEELASLDDKIDFHLEEKPVVFRKTLMSIGVVAFHLIKGESEHSDPCYLADGYIKNPGTDLWPFLSCLMDKDTEFTVDEIRNELQKLSEYISGSVSIPYAVPAPVKRRRMEILLKGATIKRKQVPNRSNSAPAMSASVGSRANQNSESLLADADWWVEFYSNVLFSPLTRSQRSTLTSLLAEFSSRSFSQAELPIFIPSHIDLSVVYTASKHRLNLERHCETFVLNTRSIDLRDIGFLNVEYLGVLDFSGHDRDITIMGGGYHDSHGFFTLKERLVFELAYHAATGRNFTGFQQHTKKCRGSRLSPGVAPNCFWDGNKMVFGPMMSDINLLQMPLYLLKYYFCRSAS